MALIEFSNGVSSAHRLQAWARHWYKMYQEREVSFIYYPLSMPTPSKPKRKLGAKRWIGYLIHSLVLSLIDFLRECVYKLDRLSSKIIYRFDL